MKKISTFLTLCLIIALMLVVTGCSAKNNGEPINTQTSTVTASAPVSETTETPAVTEGEITDIAYETTVFSDTGITINYPQLTNLPNVSAQTIINGLIKDSALRDQSFLDEEKGHITYELNYEVTYLSSRFISIIFDGYSYFEGAAHPGSFLYSATIDLQEQTYLKLSDLVTINDGFVELFKTGEYSSMFVDMTDELKDSMDLVLNQYDNEGWIMYLSDTDIFGLENTGGLYSYLTEDALVISVDVPYAMGGHAEISISYDDLGDYQTDSPFWDEISAG